MSPATLHFACSGCDATAEGTKPLRQGIVTEHGLAVEPVRAIDTVPEGWVLFDPYTGCTYCPTCWQEIEGGVRPDRET